MGVIANSDMSDSLYEDVQRLNGSTKLYAVSGLESPGNSCYNEQLYCTMHSFPKPPIMKQVAAIHATDIVGKENETYLPLTAHLALYL